MEKCHNSRTDPFALATYGALAGANTYRFSSKEWNGNSGLYYYLYRFYDPSLQRWLNRDPITETGFYKATRPDYTLFNLQAKDYVFAINDPINWGDYRGLYAVCCRTVDAEPDDPILTQLFGDLIRHCEIDDKCPKDYDSYPIEPDPNCGQCPRPDPDKCLKDNPYSAGNGTWGNNCQSNTLGRLKKCCLKAPGWHPNFYAYPPPPAPPPRWTVPPPMM